MGREALVFFWGPSEAAQQISMFFYFDVFSQVQRLASLIFPRLFVLWPHWVSCRHWIHFPTVVQNAQGKGYDVNSSFWERRGARADGRSG